MKRVIFICKGNMFRSQVAQALYNQLKKDNSIAISYGTWVEKEDGLEKKLSSYPELMVVFNILKKYNLDISNEVRKQINEDCLNETYKIVLMAEREFIPDWLQKYEYEYWEIPNPEVHVIQEIEEIIKLIRENVLKLINQ